MIQVQSFTFNPFYENTYVVFDESKDCIIIDPGQYEQKEEDAIEAFITENDLNPSLLVNTHCHIDHVLGNQHVKNSYGIPLAIHPLDKPTLESVKIYAPNYGFPAYQEATPDTYLEEGNTIQVGNQTLDILFVPGHAPGHIALVHKTQKICLSGDVLFQKSIGRTDLPGGDFDTLISSIKNKLFPLDSDMVVYPGHGPTTTIGEEKLQNPFLNR